MSEDFDDEYTFPDRILLAEEGWQEVCDAIENPRPPTAAMRALFQTEPEKNTVSNTPENEKRINVARDELVTCCLATTVETRRGDTKGLAAAEYDEHVAALSLVIVLMCEDETYGRTADRVSLFWEKFREKFRAGSPHYDGLDCSDRRGVLEDACLTAVIAERCGAATLEFHQVYRTALSLVALMLEVGWDSATAERIRSFRNERYA